MDYYRILELNRDADVALIKRRYKELVQRWHPSIHADNKTEAIQKYNEITEAFEVLSDAKNRVVYDQYGITGLKKGVPNENGKIVGGVYEFKSNPDEVFREAFGRNPFTEFFDFSQVTPSEAKGTFNEFAQMNIPPKKLKSKPIYHDLPCTLEELFNGATHRVDYDRIILSKDGVTTEKRKETAVIQIRKGMKEGDEVVFEKQGNVSQNETQGDVIFVVKEAKHSRFSRSGNDLIYQATVSLGDALLGAIVKVPTLDDRTLSIGVSDIIHPGYTQVVPGEGLPINKIANSGKRFSNTNEDVIEKGDLILKFVIVFPENLSEKQKKLLSEADL